MRKTFHLFVFRLKRDWKGLIEMVRIGKIAWHLFAFRSKID